jgi:hypothetical protein
MTLKEKLQEEKLYINPHSFKLTTEGAESFEKIADEFAIGFAKWCLADFYISLQPGIDAKADTMEELLEIYKKEKEL